MEMKRAMLLWPCRGNFHAWLIAFTRLEVFSLPVPKIGYWLENKEKSNYCWLMTAWSWRSGNFVSIFFWKRPLMVKSSKFCSESFHGDTDWHSCPKGNGGNRALFTSQKNFGSLKLSQLRGSCPKSARASPQHLAHSVPDIMQIGSLSAEF